MKITIEPTGYDKDIYPTVVVSRPDDGLTIDKVVDELLRPALLAWGFHPDTVVDALFPEERDTHP